MKSEEFGQAANEVIQATLRIYIEATHLMRDLRSELQQESMRVFPLASISDGDPAFKTLKGWRGFLGAPGLYEPGKKKKNVLKEVDLEEEEGDSDKGRGRVLKIMSGRPLLFGKILLHDYPRKVSPSFIGGVLSGATTTAETAPAQTEFRFKSDQARKILDRLNAATWAGGTLTIPTEAKIEAAAGSPKKRKKGGPTLQFDLRQEPVRRTLWELDGPDTVQQLADALMTQWKAAVGQ